MVVRIIVLLDDVKEYDLMPRSRVDRIKKKGIPKISVCPFKLIRKG
jgi:hypothetical protein